MLEYVSCHYEAQRREYQQQAFIALKEADWIVRMINGRGRKIKIMDETPYWTQEEKDAARVQMYKERMMRWANNGG